MKKLYIALLTISLFASTSNLMSEQEYETGRHLDFWLKNYSVISQRVVLVLPGVEMAQGASLNGKLSPLTRDSDHENELKQLLLETHGIEILLFRDDLAVCQWTKKEEYIPAREKAKRDLAAIGLTEDKIPQRIVKDPRLTLEPATRN